MRVILPNGLTSELFQLEDAARAEILAEMTTGQIYCWKTSGRSNWLERRLSIVDVIGLVILPQGQPDWVDMPDDDEHENDPNK
jgi:hypothetical protein